MRGQGRKRVTKLRAMDMCSTAGSHVATTSLFVSSGRKWSLKVLEIGDGKKNKHCNIFEENAAGA